MSKKDFIGELVSYGTGIAMLFLVSVGLAIAMVVFLILVGLAAFLGRLLN